MRFGRITKGQKNAIIKWGLIYFIDSSFLNKLLSLGINLDHKQRQNINNSYVINPLECYAISKQKLVSPANLFAKNTRKVIIEIGFGDASNLIYMAKTLKNVNFIGIDPYLSGVGKCLLKEGGKLDNIAFYNGLAENFLINLKPNSINGINILFPDPWHKRRHKKRRLLFNFHFWASVFKVLKLNAFIFIESDNVEFANDFDLFLKSLKFNNILIKTKPAFRQIITPFQAKRKLLADKKNQEYNKEVFCWKIYKA